MNDLVESWEATLLRIEKPLRIRIRKMLADERAIMRREAGARAIRFAARRLFPDWPKFLAAADDLADKVGRGDLIP